MLKILIINIYSIIVYTKPNAIKNIKITFINAKLLKLKIVLLGLFAAGIANDWQKLANNKFGGAKFTAILGNFSLSHCFLNNKLYVIIGNNIIKDINAKNQIAWKNSRGSIFVLKRPAKVDAVEIPTIGTNQLPYIDSSFHLCFFKTNIQNNIINIIWIRTPIHKNIAPIIWSGGILPWLYCQPARKPPTHIIVILYVGKNDEESGFLTSKNNTFGCKICLNETNKTITIAIVINGIEIHQPL